MKIAIGTHARVFLALVPFSILVGCGDGHAIVAMSAATDTPAAASSSASPATVAVPDEHRGNPIDFLQSILADNDQRARQYLAPGSYPNVTSLQAMLGLPKPSGSYNLGTLRAYPETGTLGA